MKVDKRTLAKLEARRAARARGREYSPLEAIEPTRSAQALLICGHIVFALVLLLEGAALLFAIAEGDVFMVLGALAIIAISSLVYLIAIRLCIAPLMTWHYARENAESLRQIREELCVLAAQGATAPKPRPPPPPPPPQPPPPPPPPTPSPRRPTPR